MIDGNFVWDSGLGSLELVYASMDFYSDSTLRVVGKTPHRPDSQYPPLKIIGASGAESRRCSLFFPWILYLFFSPSPVIALICLFMCSEPSPPPILESQG